METTGSDPNPARRGFLAAALGLACGFIAALCPPLAGLVVFADPMRRGEGPRRWLRLTTLASLPEDGTPRRFVARTDRQDAWSRYPESPVGAVYLRRTGPNRVLALSVICPHAGCHVEFAAATRTFECPCHKSSFALDGAIANSGSPSPRGLDPLPVEVRESGEVWIQHLRYRVGTAGRIPVG